MTIKYGIISTAQVVPRFIAGVQESENGEVVAVASRDLAKASEFAKQHQVPKAYGSYQELYQDAEIDIVYIATYNAGHYQAAKEALLAGKHVLLEKPFTLRLSEAKELFAIAKEQKVFLMEAQKALFLPITGVVKNLIATGEIGEIKRITSTTAYPNIDHVTWFRDLAAGGGTLHGSGSYPLQYLMHLLATEITAQVGTAVFHEEASDSQVDLSLRFGEDILANIFITTELDLPAELKIIGTKGSLNIPNFWKTDRATMEQAGIVNQLEFPMNSEFVFEINHVNECLTKGLTTSPMMTPEITLKTVEIVENYYRQWGKAI